jgi:hypothetical protein
LCPGPRHASRLAHHYAGARDLDEVTSRSRLVQDAPASTSERTSPLAVRAEQVVGALPDQGAFERQSLCADDFERGNARAWSATTP